MPIDPGARRLLAALQAGPPIDQARLAIDDRRRSFAAATRLAGAVPAGIGVAERTVAGAAGPLAARVYTAERGARILRPGLVWLHGGGLVAGDLDTHDPLCRQLAAGSGCRIVSVAYRLAPEHPFPAAIEDACAAVADVLDRAEAFGLDVGRIAVGGDSAGGGLAAAVSQALRDRGGVRLALQVLLCPVLDARGDTPSRHAFADGYGLDAALMARDLGDLALPDRDDPRLSPLRARDLSGLPPAIIHTAEFDPLRDEGAAYAEALARDGVPVAYRCQPGMIHHFYGLAGAIPAAVAPRDALAGEIGERLASEPDVA